MSIIGKTENKRGRPATGRDPSVTIRLPKPLLTWIDAQAEEKEIGRSEMVRRLIEESRLEVPQNVSRIRTAYHEAGHAVVARALGWSVTVATIKPEDETLGHVMLDARTLSLSDQPTVCSRIMISMAGREAERMVLGFHHDTKADRRDRSNIRHAQRFLTLPGATPSEWRPLTDIELRAILDMLESDTWGLLMNRFRESTRRVASALLRAESLTGRQIDAIIAATGERIDTFIIATGERIDDVFRPGDPQRWNENFKSQLSDDPVDGALDEADQ